MVPGQVTIHLVTDRAIIPLVTDQVTIPLVTGQVIIHLVIGQVTTLGDRGQVISPDGALQTKIMVLEIHQVLFCIHL